MSASEVHCNVPPGSGINSTMEKDRSHTIEPLTFLEKRIRVYQSKLAAQLDFIWGPLRENSPIIVYRNVDKEDGTDEKRHRSSSRTGWVKNIDMISRKLKSPCECEVCRHANNPRPAVAKVTVVTSLKKNEKQKAKSVNIRYKNGGAEDKLRRPKFVDEDVNRGLFSFTYATHDLNTLKRLKEARNGLQDCLEKMNQNSTTKSRDTLMPERRVLVTYFSHETCEIVQMEKLSTNTDTEDVQYINNETDIFFTYTGDQHGDELEDPVLVISINLQDSYPEETRFNCLIRWYTEKPLVLLIPVITACVINIVCIVVLSSLSRMDMNKNITTIICVPRDALTPHTADENFHKILGEICIKHRNDIDQCCIDSSESVKGLLEVVMKSGASAKLTDLKSMDPQNFVFSKASAHKAYIRTDFAIELSDKHLLSDEFPIFYKDRNCSLGMDPYRHNHVLLEHNRAVAVTKEGFQITEAGIYYVYTSVLFKPDTGRPCNDYEYQTWGHWVKLTRPGKFQDDMVLSTYHTCGDNTARNKDTSYTGRVMYLEAGDKLHAEVSGYGLISYQAYSNFMGLYLIHDGQGAE